MPKIRYQSMHSADRSIDVLCCSRFVVGGHKRERASLSWQVDWTER